MDKGGCFIPAAAIFCTYLEIRRFLDSCFSSSWSRAGGRDRGGYTSGVFLYSWSWLSGETVIIQRLSNFLLSTRSSPFCVSTVRFSVLCKLLCHTRLNYWGFKRSVA